MKNRKLQILLIVSTFLFLLLLLYIQINRLIQTADTERRHFNQSVKLSLDLAAAEISQDRQICENVKTCLKDTSSAFVKKLKQSEWNKVDSIIKYNLEQYDIDLAYEFEIVYMDDAFDADKHEICSTGCLDISLQQGSVQLCVKFPEENKFLIERISTMFISSILLIFLVTASFIITLNMYLREKKLAVQIKNFINNLAHEFKTPLASIGFANSRIKNSNEVALSDKLLKYTEIIEDEKNKLQVHLSEMLELACLENKSVVFKREDVNIKEILEEAIKGSCIFIEEKKGELHYNCTASEAIIKGSKRHLLNSFANIIENSCKYSNGNLKLDIRCFNDEKQVVVEIKDNGIGMATKELKLIFDKYYRISTGDIHNIKGYGIGLSYVKEVVQQHSGKIEVESKPGKGSTFKVFLPLEKSMNNVIVK